MSLFPPHVKREIFRNRFNRIFNEEGFTPRARACLGRFQYFANEVPEGDIEIISWSRAGDNPGFMNRSQRRHHAHNS